MITDTIKINGLDFDIHSGPVGISHSGGADSSIMLHILFKYAAGPIHVFTCASTFKNRSNPRVSYNVIDYLIELHGRHDIYHHIFFTEVQTFSTLFIPLTNFIKSNNLTVMYTAGTALPPDSDLANFVNNTPLYGIRNQNIKRPVYDTSGKFYTPWWNMDKKFVAGVYQEMGLVDTLFPITRSCEDLQLKEGHCGRCWWCEERFWAFGKY